MKKIIGLAILFAVLLSSCTQSSRTFNDSVRLSGGDTLNFVIDDSTYYESKAMFQFEHDGKEYLFFQTSRDKGVLRVLIYDIEKENLYRSVPLYKQGPNGIPGLLGGYPLGMNRFLITAAAPFIYIVNGKGHITFKSEPLFNNRQFGEYCLAMFYSYYASPAIRRDSMVYYAQTSIGYPHTEDTWKTSNIFSYVDLQTGELGRTKFCYPSVFNGKELERRLSYEVDHSYADTGKEVAVSFTQTDSIYVSSDFEHVRAYDARSRYFPSLQPEPYDVTKDTNIWLRKKNRKPDYYHLLYDKYRKVFYRFARMPYEFPSDESPMGEDKGREFSIVVLNDKYEIIGETRFPGNTYNYRMCFVGKKGLYISLNNLGNPDFSENILSFRCFTLENAKE